MEQYNLVKNTSYQIPQAGPNAKHIVGLVKDGRDSNPSKWGCCKIEKSPNRAYVIASQRARWCGNPPSGNAISNLNVSANMLRSKFYVCPVCGNIVHSNDTGITQLVVSK